MLKLIVLCIFFFILYHAYKDIKKFKKFIKEEEQLKDKQIRTMELKTKAKTTCIDEYNRELSRKLNDKFDESNN